MTDNVKDIFTKKDLSEIEAKRKAEEDEYEESLKFNLQAVIDHQQELLDNGDLSGLAFIATTKTSYRIPVIEYDTVGDLIKMNMLADLLKDTTVGMCTIVSLPEEEQYEDM